MGDGSPAAGSTHTTTPLADRNTGASRTMFGTANLPKTQPQAGVGTAALFGGGGARVRTDQSSPLKMMPAWAAVGSQISTPVTTAATASRMTVRMVVLPCDVSRSGHL